MVAKEYLFPFYRWSLTEVERDNAEDFAFVRKFEYAGAWTYLQFIDCLDEERQREFSMARLRYGHARILETPGVQLSNKESGWIASYFEFIRRPEIMQERLQATLPAPPARPLTHAGFVKD
ncbi:MAG: hypothetical protein ABSH22_19895, partial [Tepidisphaeraceae bacterium]